MYPLNEVDIGMLPSSGLRSPSLSQSEIEEEIPSSLKSSSLKVKRLLSTKKIASRETESLQRKACDMFSNFLCHENSKNGSY